MAGASFVLARMWQGELRRVWRGAESSHGADCGSVEHLTVGIQPHHLQSSVSRAPFVAAKHVPTHASNPRPIPRDAVSHATRYPTRHTTPCGIRCSGSERTHQNVAESLRLPEGVRMAEVHKVEAACDRSEESHAAAVTAQVHTMVIGAACTSGAHHPAKCGPASCSDRPEREVS